MLALRLNTVALLLLMITTSCALRPKCNSDQWVVVAKEYGADGKALDQHKNWASCKERWENTQLQTIKDSHKEKLKSYCSDASAYSHGTQGLDYRTRLCSPNTVKSLNSKYKQGLKEYCQSMQGFEDGLSGNAINTHCNNTEYSHSFLNGRLKYIDFELKLEHSRLQLLQQKRSVRRTYRQQVIIRNAQTRNPRPGTLSNPDNRQLELNMIDQQDDLDLREQIRTKHRISVLEQEKFNIKKQRKE